MNRIDYKIRLTEVFLAEGTLEPSESRLSIRLSDIKSIREVYDKTMDDIVTVVTLYTGEYYCVRESFEKVDATHEEYLQLTNAAGAPLTMTWNAGPWAAEEEEDEDE